LAVCFAVKLGFLGFTRLRVMSVDAEFRVESMLDMMAAISPASTIPFIPTGRIFATIVGNTISGSVRLGKTEKAITRELPSQTAQAVSDHPKNRTPAQRPACEKKIFPGFCAFVYINPDANDEQKIAGDDGNV